MNMIRKQSRTMSEMMIAEHVELLFLAILAVRAILWTLQLYDHDEQNETNDVPVGTCRERPDSSCSQQERRAPQTSSSRQEVYQATYQELLERAQALASLE